MSVHSEQDLLKAILRRDKSIPDQVVVANGDDAAVISNGRELLVVTTDNFVEGLDFNRDFSTPEQIGMRAAEASASDVVAMGGKPTFCFVSLSLPKAIDLRFLHRVYDGLYQSLERLGARLLGGDTTAGVNELALNITFLGEIRPPAKICTRGGAKAGDLVFVSGAVGSAAAGLATLKNGTLGFEDIKRCHQAPRCRIDLVDLVAPYATSMIDISDGLAHELHLLCEASAVGCVIEQTRIPINPTVLAAANVIGNDPLNWALGGGDDYELIYTVPQMHRCLVPGNEIGVITKEREILLDSFGSRTELPKLGYDHIQPVREALNKFS